MNSADDLAARLQRMAERAQQRNRERTPEPTLKLARVVRLPLWPEELRTCPSCVLRSALFGVVRRGRRQARTRPHRPPALRWPRALQRLAHQAPVAPQLPGYPGHGPNAKLIFPSNLFE